LHLRTFPLAIPYKDFCLLSFLGFLGLLCSFVTQEAPQTQ
jgi:hypothetical protein